MGGASRRRAGPYGGRDVRRGGRRAEEGARPRREGPHGVGATVPAPAAPLSAGREPPALLGRWGARWARPAPSVRTCPLWGGAGATAAPPLQKGRLRLGRAPASPRLSGRVSRAAAGRSPRSDFTCPFTGVVVTGWGPLDGGGRARVQ